MIKIDDNNFKQVNFFNEMIPQQGEFDDLMEERLKDLMRESAKLVPSIIDHPSAITKNDVQRSIMLHNELISFDKFSFYKDFFNYFYPEEKKHYYQIIEKVPDK